jgi:hypothetical protein
MIGGRRERAEWIDLAERERPSPHGPEDCHRRAYFFDRFSKSLSHCRRAPFLPFHHVTAARHGVLQVEGLQPAGHVEPLRQALRWLSAATGDAANGLPTISPGKPVQSSRSSMPSYDAGALDTVVSLVPTLQGILEMVAAL